MGVVARKIAPTGRCEICGGVEACVLGCGWSQTTCIAAIHASQDPWFPRDLWICSIDESVSRYLASKDVKQIGQICQMPDVMLQL
jgi:hypothetical protein